MDHIHIIVASTADLAFTGALAVMIVAAAVMFAWAAGHKTGIRDERAAAARRDAADLQDTVDEFGPLRLAVEDRAALRRIK